MNDFHWDMDALEMMIDRVVKTAHRRVEYAALAGDDFAASHDPETDDDDMRNPFVILSEFFTRKAADMIELKNHSHEWATDEENDRCYCLICGADGDA